MPWGMRPFFVSSLALGGDADFGKSSLVFACVQLSVAAGNGVCPRVDEAPFYLALSGVCRELARLGIAALVELEELYVLCGR